MIENGGGNVATQYFMWLALYPTMAYDDWKGNYTERISPQMLQIID